MTNQVDKLKEFYNSWLREVLKTQGVGYGRNFLADSLQSTIVLCEFFLKGVPTTLISEPISQYMVSAKAKVLCKRCKQSLGDVGCEGCVVSETNKRIDRATACLKMFT